MAEYVANVLIFAVIYALFAASLSIAAGYTGLVSVGHSAFYAAGAYAAALLSVKLGAPFPVTLVCAAISAGVCGAIASWPAIRLRGDFLLLGTLAFSQLTVLVLKNWVSLTNGPAGITGIPSPRALWLGSGSVYFYLLITSAVAGFCILLQRAAISAPFGRVLEAIRENEAGARSLGIDVASFKLRAFITSAAFTGVAGALYAHYVTFVNPDAFGVNESVLALVIVILGGGASIRGAVIGAFILVLIPEALRFTPLPAAQAAAIRQMIYGGLLIALMVFRSQGLFGKEARPSPAFRG